MNAEVSRIEISGLNNLDLVELQSEVHRSGLSLEVSRNASAQSSDHRHRHGELATAAVILALTPAVLKVISIWLNRRHSGDSFEETLTVVAPDGSRKEHIIKFRRDKSEAAEAGILAEIRKSIALDHSVLNES
jgi:hypothetical protein